jgi:hypothetical protein
MMSHTPSPSAALAGIPSGLQAQGLWAGRRQLFVRFAAEAETATMYTAEALAGEIRRGISGSAFHSISISGRDPLANVEYICAVFDKASPSIPVMLDDDGQRPEAIHELRAFLTLAQFTVDGPAGEPQAERVFESLEAASKAGIDQALVLNVDERTTDAHVLRLIERAQGASATASVVVHPGAGIPVDRDRRWTILFERAVALHRDVRFVLRLPPPTGMR